MIVYGLPFRVMVLFLSLSIVALVLCSFSWNGNVCQKTFPPLYKPGGRERHIFKVLIRSCHDLIGDMEGGQRVSNLELSYCVF